MSAIDLKPIPTTSRTVEIELDGYSHDDGRILNGGASSFEIEYQEDLPKAKWYHATFHSVCAVVGAGVLGLPFSFSYLGWAAGFFFLTILCAASLYTSYLLANMHEYRGQRLNTYTEMAEAIWGEKPARYGVQTIQYMLLVGLCITYSVTAGQSLKGVVSTSCSGADCEEGLGPWIVLFGISQLALSQVPDFHSLWWVSLLGGVMSIGYCSIAIGASAAAAAESEKPSYIREDESTADQFFGILNAMGSMAFTFGGQAVLPEIQATLARPPPTSESMMRSVWASYVVVILAYYLVALTGYGAFGVAVSSDVLLSIQHPALLVDAANLMVVFHVAAGYQVFAQPVFHACEEVIKHKINRPIRPVALRLIFRSIYVVLITFVAYMLPFFHDLMGLIASIGLIPISFIIPPLLWLSMKKRYGVERVVCISIASFTSVLAVLAFIGSMRNIIVDSVNFDVFGE